MLFGAGSARGCWSLRSIGSTGQAPGAGRRGVSHCALSQEEFAELSKALAEPCVENAAEAARAIFDASEQLVLALRGREPRIDDAVGFLNDFSFIPGFDEDLAAWALRLDGKIAWPKRVLGGCLSMAAGKAESSAWDAIEEIPWTLGSRQGRGARRRKGV